MNSENLSIQIRTKFDGSGTAAAQQGFRNVTKAADDMIDALKLGVGIDLGGRIVQQISQIPAILQGAVARGVAFNRTIADSETAIAQMVQRFAGLDAVAAKAEAAKAIAKIKEVEPEAAGSLQDLTRGFLSVYGAAAKTGAPIESMVELVGKAANALSNLNLPAEQLSSELRMILAGNITQDSALGKILGVTADQVGQWTAAGTLIDEITTRIGSLGSAGDTAAVRMSSFGSAIDQALGKLAEPITRALDQAIVELTADIQKLPEAELKRFGSDLATLVHHGADLTNWLVRHPGLILGIAKAVGTLAAAWTAVKLTELIAGLGVKAARIIATQGALTAETAALATNTRAWRANATARAGGAGGGGVGGAMRGVGGALLGWGPAVAAGGMMTADWIEKQSWFHKLIGYDPNNVPDFPADWRPDARPGGSTRRPSGPARVLSGDAPIDFLAGDPGLAKARAEALGAGLGGDEEWAAKMARAEELRGFLGTTLGLGKGFNAEQAVAAIESSGTETQQEEVLEIAKELFGLEKDIAGMQEDSAEWSRQSAEQAKDKADARERELAALREQQAEMQKQARSALDDMRPSIGAEATTTGGRGGTLRRKARAGYAADVKEALGAAGIDPDSAEGRRIAAEKLGGFDDQMRATRGRFGGTATRSERDRLGGFANLGDTGLRGIRTGTGPSDDWKLNFGDRVQTSPANAPATATAPGGASGKGNALDGAAGKLNSGGNAIDTAAAKIDGAGTQIQSAATRLGAAADRLGNAASGLEAKVRNLETRVGSLEGNEGR